MEAIFVRLLKVLWVYWAMTAIFIVGAGFYGVILQGYGVGSLPSNFAYLAVTAIILIAVQYVLLGNFDPRRLVKRKIRYPR